MSQSISQSQQEPSPHGVLDWCAFVEARLTHEWRLDEWDRQTLLFTGVLDTSRTLAFTCSTPACGMASRTKVSPCYECQQQQKLRATADGAAFRRIHTANRRWSGVELTPCVITHGGERCERTASKNGLCRSHWSMWLGRRRRGLEFDEFLQTCTSVYSRRAECRIVGCDHEQVGDKWRLCEPHDQQFMRWGLEHNGRDIASFMASARPFVRIHQFSLAGLAPSLRSEIVYVLQQRDSDGFHLDPTMVRTVLKKCHERTVDSLLDFSNSEIGAMPRSNENQRSFLRSARLHLTRLRALYDGCDLRETDVWDVAVLGLQASRQRKYAAVRGVLDFSVISVPWMKALVKEWVHQTEPDVVSTRRGIRAAEVVCSALCSRPGGLDPTVLRLVDMTAVVRHINDLTRDDGSRYSFSQRCAHLNSWREILEFGRAADLMVAVPGEFALLTTHRLDREQPETETVGKALTAEVVRFLDHHVDLLRPSTDRLRAGWSADDYAAMYQTMYVVFRNTGRRLDEVMSLKRGCLRFNESGEATLVYDNRKAGRLGRWLPIDKETADAIELWQQRVQELEVLVDLRIWLFPSPGSRRRRKAGYYTGSAFLSVFRDWRDALPPIPHGGLAPDGRPRLFDITLIHTHAFRHTYAQRHADGGTPVDVLKELMDHESINVTMGYYQVSLKRKASAVRAVGALAVDREGNPRPESDALAYERKSVSVPYGNCTEPSNVKAGGEHCPIRYQCAGCDFYRPDPSFLPAIEEQIAKLRVEREHALAVNAAGWVLSNYDDQISAFSRVTAAIIRLIDSLPEEQRNAINEAGAVMRRTRGARTYLPLTLIDRTGRDGSE